MKKPVFIILLFVFHTTVYGQSKAKTNYRDFSIYLETPLFFSAFANKTAIYTVNLEYLSKTNLSLSFGYGRAVTMNHWNITDLIIKSEINKIIGGKHNYFEVGGGLAYVAIGVMGNFRIGYRGMFGRRILVRVAYTPYFFLFEGNDIIGPVDNTLSVGLGYRFGININKEGWNTNWKWLSGLQLTWQPLYRNYKDAAGNEMSANLEFLLAKSGNLRFKANVGFGYSISKHNYVKCHLTSIPAGFSILYGREKHFIETGLRASWTPIGGNSDGTFFTLQPELGYRIHLWKRFMARVAYSPYWWLSDKEGREYIEKKFVNSVTVGVGVRFH